jgi:hypothetical protein
VHCILQNAEDWTQAEQSGNLGYYTTKNMVVYKNHSMFLGNSILGGCKNFQPERVAVMGD